jgi:SnoaL-like polyketide cyclase
MSQNATLVVHRWCREIFARTGGGHVHRGHLVSRAGDRHPADGACPSGESRDVTAFWQPTQPHVSPSAGGAACQQKKTRNSFVAGISPGRRSTRRPSLRARLRPGVTLTAPETSSTTGTTQSPTCGGIESRFQTSDLSSTTSSEKASWWPRSARSRQPTGKYFDVEPTGREVRSHSLAIHRVVDGQVVESRTMYDGPGFLAQLKR